MTEFLWTIIARIASRPRISAWLIRQAQKRPYIHIGDYMHRWWLVPERRWLPLAIRVHHIRLPDADPYLHDHPYNWRTIVLRGWYVEEDVFGQWHVRLECGTRAASAETLHRINNVSSGGVWTLFILLGKRRNRWGFMVGNPARKIHWEDYQSTNNREAA